MNIDFSKLIQKRQNWVEANKENNFDEGINNLLTELYPDNAHFIYELLQNAEDAGATEVKFELLSNELRFSHNGKIFDYADVEGITSIGQGTKADEVNKIGKFGVGFKAVFSYSLTPEIYSGSYSFQIDDLVVPTPIKPTISNQTTLMIFPFNNPKKLKEEAYKEVKKGLNDIKDNTLLFLTNIETLSYSFNGENYNIQRIVTDDIVVNIKNSRNKTDTKWLRFKKYLPKSHKLYVSVAFQAGIDKSTGEEYIKPINGQVAIFFPAEKENSNLRFHIHAPFSSTVARDSLKEQKDNQELINLICKLFLDVLRSLKQKKLLDYSFLTCLPNNEDNLSEFYLPIQKSLIEFFNKEKFLITDTGVHRSASECFLLDNDYSKELMKPILKSFVQYQTGREYQNIYYVASDKVNNRIRKFIQMLEVEELSDQNIIESFKNLTTNNGSLQEVIGGESDKWFKRLYVFFDRKRSYLEQFKKLIRLSNDSLNFNQENCYFSQRSDIKQLAIVKESTYSRNPEAKSFLEKLGVKEIGEKEEIQIILKENYQKNFVETDRHLEHIQKFIRFYERHKTDIDFFRKYKFIRVSEFDGYEKVEKIYIDAPFQKTGMATIGKDNKSLFSLSDIYHSLEKDRKKVLVEFLKRLGVLTQLPIDKVERLTVYFHKGRDWIPKCDKRRNSTYRQFTDYVFKYNDLLKEDNIDISLLIWNRIKNLEEDKLNAYFQFKKNRDDDDLIDDSTLLHELKNKSWIPNNDGEFFKPQDISKKMLHNEFVYEVGNVWFEAIEFGKNIRENEEEYKQKEQLVEEATGYELHTLEELKKLGITNNDLEELKKQKLRESLEKNQGDGESEEFVQARNNETQILDDERYKNAGHEENKNNQNKFTTSQTNYKKQDLKEVEKVQDFLYKEYEGHCQICGDTFAYNGQNTYTMKSLNIGKSRDVNRKGNTLCLCFKHYEIFKRNLQKNLFVDKIKIHEKSTKLEIENADKIFELYDCFDKEDKDHIYKEFYQLHNNDEFIRDDIYFLPIQLFEKGESIKFTKAHLIEFIEVWNEN